MQTGLEPKRIELVKNRASQLNGCAFCVDMHTRDTRRQGEAEQRLCVLDAWRDSPLFDDRERAALAWTESLTLVAQTHAPDDAYDDVHTHCTPEEQVQLTLLIVAINGWNRIQVGFLGIHPVRSEAA